MQHCLTNRALEDLPDDVAKAEGQQDGSNRPFTNKLGEPIRPAALLRDATPDHLSFSVIQWAALGR